METTAEPHEQRIARILHKLDQVRRRGLTCFGADTHQFRLNPPLNERDVRRFEEEHRIRLPEDYRAFLVLAGNGGAGPHYGLYKLDRWNDFIDWVCDDVPADVLSRPCPLRSDMARDDGWESRLEPCVSPYQGMITLGSQGCTYETGLIVAGPCAGRVVYLDANGYAPYLVRESDFLAWYERWLDEILGGYDLFGFGFGLGGDEPKIMCLLDDPATPEADRAEAVRAMIRLPRLSDRGRERLCQLVDDPTPGVRAAACHAVKKFAVREAAASFPGLLRDPSPEVLRAAIAAGMSLEPAIHEADVRRLLNSDDGEVAQRAYSSLKDCGLLTPDDTMTLVTTSPHGSLRYWSAQSIEWEPTHTPLLVGLLQDGCAQVRNCAVYGLARIRSAASLDAVIGLLDRETDGNVTDRVLRMLGDVPGDRNADVLLAWAVKGDDFQRLEAVGSLCKLGEVRVAPVAEGMLGEARNPERWDANGFGKTSKLKTVRELVAEHLRASPNPELRRLAGERRA